MNKEIEKLPWSVKKTNKKLVFSHSIDFEFKKKVKGKWGEGQVSFHFFSIWDQLCSYVLAETNQNKSNGRDIERGF